MYKKLLISFTIFLVLAVNLGLGLNRIGNYSSVDEPYWTYGRISKFWKAVETHKWRSTDINDKPGITVAIISGLGLLKYQPMDYKSLRGEVKTPEQLSDINNINFYFRLPIYLFCILLLPVFYLLLRKLFNQTTALIGFILLGLSPILLGISLIINPDSLLWIFLPLSLLSYLVYQKEQRKHYLWLAGFLLGLSLLTKYVANILYIFFFLLPFLDYILSEKKPVLSTYLKKAAIDYLLLAAISMFTYWLLYPAAWRHLDVLLQGTFLSKAFKTTWPLFAAIIALVALDMFAFKNKVTGWILDFFSKHKNLITKSLVSIFLLLILATIANTYLGMKPYDLEEIIISPKGIGEGSMLSKFTGAFLANTYALIFGISPLALIGVFAALVLPLSKKKLAEQELKVVVYFALFILFYYLGSSVNDVIATVRYQITLFPLALIIAAIGLNELLAFVPAKNQFKQGAAVCLLFLVSVLSLISIKPFYFAYASSLLPNKYLLNYKDMGDGSFEAAQYLNNLPNPEKLTIWSDKGAVCAVFRGKCIIGFNPKKIKGTPFDYVVTSAGRKSRTLKLSGGVNDYLNFRKAYSTDTVDKLITIGNRQDNFIKIISAQSILIQR